MRFFSCAGGFVAVAVSAFVVLPAYAQTQVSLSNVVDSTGGEFSAIYGSAINNAGTVAFLAFRKAGVGGGTGIYTVNASGTTTTALLSNSGFSQLASPSLSNSGTIAFTAVDESVSPTASARRIYKVTAGGTRTTVATSAIAEFNYFQSLTINASDRVAFTSERDNGAQGTYTATTSPTFTTIARTDTSSEFNIFGTPDINDNGLVAFFAVRDDVAGGGRGIYTATDSGSFNTIARTDTSGEFAVFGGAPSINNSGVVAFYSTRDAGGQAIYTATDGSGFTTIASSSSAEFADFLDPYINNLGTVAFIANRDSGGKGLYAKLAGQSDITAIVRTGDSFQNSTIADVFFFQGLADDSNTLAFQYQLANGIVGIGKATVVVIPEPRSVALLGTGIFLFSGAVVRRRK